MSTKAIFAGVDPGLTGALALIDQDSRPIVSLDVSTRRRAIASTAIKKEFDVRPMADQLTDRLVNYVDYKWFACIEMPFSRPGGNMMGTNSLFQTYGGLMVMLEMIEFEVTPVKPSEWKRGFNLTKDKRYSLDVANKMWPTAGLHAMKDHNRAEAYLLAEYGRLTWEREQRISGANNV